MKVTIYHNPTCGTSRGALAIIREKGIEPTIIEYLKTPLTKDQLKALIARMGVPVKDVVRWKQKDEVAEAGISESSSDEALLDAMAKFPILMNRPIVVTDKGVKLCRPGETVGETSIMSNTDSPLHCRIILFIPDRREVDQYRNYIHMRRISRSFFL